MDAFETTFIKAIDIADGTLAIQLEKPDGFTFTPGQHIGVKILNPPETDSAGNIRTLSIASAPNQDVIEIATRLRDSAFKRSLEKLEKGAVFEMDGPYGSMTLHEDTDTPVVFVAGGIGITPFISMIRHELEEREGYDITLFYSNRTPDEAAYLEELQDISKRNITIVPTMTRTSEDSEWSGKTGYITDEMIADELDDVTEAVYYLAGPNEFVKAMETVLKEMGVPELHIRAEIFSGYE